MKVANIVIKSIIGLFILFFIAAFFGPNKYRVTRSIEIDAPISTVWNQVSLYNNWKNWSPWIGVDPRAKYTLEGEDGEVGTTFSWKGNPNKTGRGSMTTTGMNINEKFEYELSFLEPYEMDAKGFLLLEEKGNKTFVKWSSGGDIPFMQRTMMLFSDIDGMIGPSFESGLLKMKDFLEGKIVAGDGNIEEYVVTEVTFEARNYLGNKQESTISEVMKQAFYQTNFMKIGGFIGENNIQMTGPPATITWEWNEKDSTCVIAPVFSVDNSVSIKEGDMKTFALKEQRAILVKYYGNYSKMHKAHDALDNYLHMHKLSHTLVIEEYVNDPTEVEEKDLLTNIYYLLED